MSTKLWVCMHDSVQVPQVLSSVDDSSHMICNVPLCALKIEICCICFVYFSLPAVWKCLKHMDEWSLCTDKLNFRFDCPWTSKIFSDFATPDIRCNLGLDGCWFYQINTGGTNNAIKKRLWYAVLYSKYEKIVWKSFECSEINTQNIFSSHKNTSFRIKHDYQYL